MLKKSNIGNIRISDTSAKILAENVKAVFCKKSPEYSGGRISISDRRRQDERRKNVQLCKTM